MKKLILICSFFLRFTFNMNIMNISATVTPSKSFSQGFYTTKDLGLLENIPYFVQNISPTNRGIIVIIDENQMIQQLIRVMPTPTVLYIKEIVNSSNTKTLTDFIFI